MSFQPGSRPEWMAGPRFADANAARYLDLLWLARLVGVGWSLLGGWLVYRWADDLHGTKAGLLALVLWCFAPDVLAHAPLMTPDLPATVAGLAACYLFWKYLREPSWSRAWFAGLMFGVALLTKFTWLLLFGLWPIIGLMVWCRRKAPIAQLAQLPLILVLGLFVLNLGYSFTGTGRALGEYRFVSRLMAGERSEDMTWGNRFVDTWLSGLPVPLPSDALLGLDTQRRDFEGEWPTYLGGEWRHGGRWYFYLYSLGVKLPLGTLVLILVAGLSWLFSRGRTSWGDELFLWCIPIVLIAVASSQTGLNYHRYVLPALPFLLIAAGRLGCLVGLRSWRRGGVILVLAVWSVGSSVMVIPHSLSYFNEAVGGPENGRFHLIDSNADWGQDLLFLRDWLREHPEVEDLKLAYFNHVDPRVVGIEFELPSLNRLEPGYYALSVHFVQGGTFTAPDGHGRWRTIPLGGFQGFQQMRPTARVGYSILIYRVEGSPK
jgi:4-amino-4-deoxy-L-arabinose transferase-like glycosyltransferase